MSLATRSVKPPSSGAPQRLPPLAGHEWLEPVSMTANPRAVVTVPLGAVEPRPLVVGVHGAGDRAEWACGGYRIMTGEFPFVVCPVGLPVGGGKFSPATVAELERAVSVATEAIRAEFGAYITPGPSLLAGFSLGAIRAVEIARQHAARFPRVLLIEGGARAWTPEVARAFVAGGGDRVLLVCAARSCDWTYEWARKALTEAGARCEVVAAGTQRHNLDGEMMAVLKERWGWLVEGDSRWDTWRASR